MNISAFSTKAIKKDGTRYKNRTPEDIDAAVHYVMKGNKEAKPVYSSSTGFTEDKDIRKISDEIKEVQALYRKESGLRIRGEIVEIWKNELQRGHENEQIAAIADGFSAHFLYKGFQTAYGVFDKGASYNVVYAINPVSYGDGSKYRHNNTDILDEQFECLKGVIDKVTDSGNMPEGYSYDGYEYY